MIRTDASAAPEIDGLDVVEVSSILYLALPVIVFLATAVRFEIAVLALLALLELTFPMLRMARASARATFRQIGWRIAIALAAIAACWVFSSGGLGLFQQNGDWSKHYALLNLLAESAWWPETDLGTLRYALGWYIVPALAVRLVGGGLVLFSAAWTCMGVLLFFALIARSTSTPRRAIAGVLLFALFGGGDAVGWWLTGFQYGPPYHLQWWAGWIEYSAPTTALYWVPQHALPAWLGIALLLRAADEPHRAPAGYAALLLVVCAFWSPFAALGLAPFAAYVMWRAGRRRHAAAAIGLSLVVAAPIVAYLVAGASGILHGFIWHLPCVQPGGQCFTWPRMAIFLGVEVGAAVAVAFAKRQAFRRDFVLLAALVLAILPLYRFGINNDLAMRASMPALAVLALAVARALAESSGGARFLPAVVFAIGLPVPLGEAARGISSPRVDLQHSRFDDVPSGYVSQYFAATRPWVLDGKDQKRK